MKKYLFLCVAVVGLLSGCSSVPITGRHQLNLVSDADVLSSSLTEYKSYMSKATVSGNKTESATVSRVGQRIANATETYLKNNGMSSEIKNFSWEFNLVDNKELNAFCMPGGKIVVYTGLMSIISSDDELAVVLGHEVAHAVAKHSNERMSQQVVAQYGSNILGAALANKSAAVQSVAGQVFGLGAQYGVMLPFSRKQESEADYMGLVLMTIAGYNPDVAVGFWQKMSSSGGQSVPEIMSSHPSDATRIANIKKELPGIKAKYGSQASASSGKTTNASATTTKTVSASSLISSTSKAKSAGTKKTTTAKKTTKKK